MKVGRNHLRQVAATLFIIVAAVGPAAAQKWVQLTAVGSPPGGENVANYDAVNNRLIAYFPTQFNQVWVLTNANGLGGTPFWIELAPIGTPPFSNGLTSAVYDPATNRLVVYGGCEFNCSPASPALPNVFVLTNANGLGGIPEWTESITTPSEPRDHQSAVYDSTSNRMIVFGGSLGLFGTDQNDTRVLANANESPSSWNALTVTGGPPGIREGHTATYDKTNNIMTIFGGGDAISTCCPYDIGNYNDVWTLSNANGLAGPTSIWRGLSAAGGRPSPRQDHSTVYDPVHNRLLVFGGAIWSNTAQSWTTLGDLWQLTNANGLGGAPQWQQLSPTGATPTAREGHGAVFDPASQRMILSGGFNSAGIAFYDTWVLTNVAGPPDTIPPVTTASASPLPNSSGWNNTDVTVTLKATDNEPGGTGVKDVHFSLSGAETGSRVVPGNTATVIISAEGATTLTYFSVDNAGNQEATKTLTIRIDRTPPVITGMPRTGCTLWPPNHKLVEVAVAKASDAVSGLASFSVKGSSNEPADSDPDIVITGIRSGGFEIQLRAERLGSGKGRIYTLTAAAGDLAGNTITAQARCVVPHDHRH